MKKKNNQKTTNKKTTQTNKRFFWVGTILFPLILFCYFLYICSRIGWFPVPDTDFFLYLNEGEALLHNPFTKSVAPPLYSMIVAFFERTLPIIHPGLTGGIIINCVSFVLSMYFLVKITYKWLGKASFIPLFMLAINPITANLYLQPTNATTAILFIIVAIYCYTKRPSLSYMFAALATLSRPEAVVLFACFPILGIIEKKRIPRLGWFIVFLSITLLWFFRPFFSLGKEDYFIEVVARLKEIPNIKFLQNTFSAVPLLFFTDYPPPVAYAFFVWITVGGVYNLIKKKPEMVLIVCLILFYCILHIFFHEEVLRYSYFILPFIYVLSCWPAMIPRTKTPKILYSLLRSTILLIIFLIGINSLKNTTTEYLEKARRVKIEKRMLADWLNKTVTTPTTIYAFEYWLPMYFTTNKLVTYERSVDISTWKNSLCDSNQTSYIVIDCQTEGAEAQYFDQVNGLGGYVEIKNSQEVAQHLFMVKKISYHERWLKIYGFNKLSGTLCNN